MQSYKELDIYQLAHRLAVEAHGMTLQDLPVQNNLKVESTYA